MKRLWRALRGSLGSRSEGVIEFAVDREDGNRLKVLIQESTTSHGTIKVYLGDVLVFDGVDRSALLGVRHTPSFLSDTGFAPGLRYMEEK